MKRNKSSFKFSHSSVNQPVKGLETQFQGEKVYKLFLELSPSWGTYVEKLRWLLGDIPSDKQQLQVGRL